MLQSANGVATHLSATLRRRAFGQTLNQRAIGLRRCGRRRTSRVTWPQTMPLVSGAAVSGEADLHRRSPHRERLAGAKTGAAIASRSMSRAMGRLFADMPRFALRG